VHLNPPENESSQEGDTVLTLGRPDRGAAVANLFESRQLGGAQSLSQSLRHIAAGLPRDSQPRSGFFVRRRLRRHDYTRRSDRRPILEMLMVTIDIRDVSVT
jgi:hypothetical protein